MLRDAWSRLEKDKVAQNPEHAEASDAFESVTNVSYVETVEECNWPYRCDCLICAGHSSAFDEEGAAEGVLPLSDIDV